MSDAVIRGVVHLIEETKEYGQRGFRKRLVVLEQDKGSFTNYLPLDFTKDFCDRADEFNEGDELEVNYRLNGRKWQRDAASEVKWFLSAEVLNFKVLSQKGAGVATEELSDTEDYIPDDDVPF
ncbi:MAG: hypothetical protein CMJ74_06280 [Planctomycetaceae bacterium]|nr:hypothetical protein [Planctomycetaceae bacterium]|tara:strand:+ start:594 stop:962 length:369 start_codon:yes stop_codon:yes gene_type:complete